jgi:hypothetical protein
MIIDTFEHPQLCSACDLGKIFLTSKLYQRKHAFHQTQVSNPTFLDLSGFLSIWSNEKSYGSVTKRKWKLKRMNLVSYNRSKQN